MTDCCYYCGPYEGGAIYFLIVDTPEFILEPVDSTSVTTILREVISSFEVDHQKHVAAFLSQQGFELSEDGGALLHVQA